MFQKLPPNVVKVLMGVEPQYIEAALDAIDAAPGGFEGYVRNALSLNARDVAALRSQYLRKN